MKSWICIGVGIGVLLTNALAHADCTLERHDGIADEDAKGIEEVVCGLVRDKAGSFRVRVTKLGSKTILTLVPPSGEEQHLVLSSLDEATVAAPRLVEATTEHTAVKETVDVTNVVGEEARQPKVRPSMVHGWLGVIGGTAASATMGGANLGLSFGAEQWSFVGELRLGGNAFNAVASIPVAIGTLGQVKLDQDAELSYVSFGGGARYHLSAQDLAPFVGAGLAVDGLSRDLQPDLRMPNSYGYGSLHPQAKGAGGLAGYAEAGVDILRTHQFGGQFTVRGEAPTFVVPESKVDLATPTQRLHRTIYTPVVTAGFALRF